jgi:hypothetical protein
MFLMIGSRRVIVPLYSLVYGASVSYSTGATDSIVSWWVQGEMV